MMLQTLNSPVVLITGSSSGIGKASADLLHQKGYRVYGTLRKKTEIKVPWNSIIMDVRKEDSVSKAVQEVLLLENKIDVLIHAAGISVVGSIEDTSVSEAMNQISSNLLSAVYLVKSVIPSMRSRKYGKIILIGSLAGITGLPYQAFYSISKFGIEGFIEALRIETKPFGIQACVLEPGDLNTEMSQNRIIAQNSNPASVYHSRFCSIMKVYEENEKKGLSALLAAKTILKIIQTKKIKPRYQVSRIFEKTGVFLKRILPSSFYEILFSLFYKIKN